MTVQYTVFIDFFRSKGRGHFPRITVTRRKDPKDSDGNQARLVKDRRDPQA